MSRERPQSKRFVSYSHLATNCELSWAPLLLRILELRRRLQRILRGIHLCDPLVVLHIVGDRNRRRRNRDIALAHTQEPTDGQDQRVDLLVLDSDVSDFADGLV